jgi:hypothetical protein
LISGEYEVTPLDKREDKFHAARGSPESAPEIRIDDANPARAF